MYNTVLNATLCCFAKSSHIILNARNKNAQYIELDIKLAFAINGLRRTNECIVYICCFV